MDAETRAYLDQTLGAFRDDVGQGFAVLRYDVGSLREDFGTLRQGVGTIREEFGTLRADFDELRREVRDSAVVTRRHFDVVAEDLRHDIRGIGAGVIALSERVDRLDVGVRAELNERFTATHAVVRVCFSDVRRDIADLRFQL